LTNNDKTPWFEAAPGLPSEHYSRLALQHTNSLTKPQGALGELEQVVVTLASLQGTHLPSIEQIAITVFAADHGIAEENVSAYPQSVTGEMVRNFSSGGAAISVLARQLKARFEVINVGTVNPLEPMANVVDCRIAAGTRNFSSQAAMTQEQLDQAMKIGADTINDLGDIDCFIGGEMGIANTTSAAALASAILSISPEQLTGQGTGVGADGVIHKVSVIEQALSVHKSHLGSTYDMLRCLGGFEIAALCGAYIRAAQQSLPILVDGFICTVAALAAVSLNPGVRPWLLFSHQSEESGHAAVLSALNAKPLLDLGMRLGEGSGAAVAVPTINMACVLHREMSSFDDAGVSQSE